MTENVTAKFVVTKVEPETQTEPKKEHAWARRNAFWIYLATVIVLFSFAKVYQAGAKGRGGYYTQRRRCSVM